MFALPSSRRPGIRFCWAVVAVVALVAAVDARAQRGGGGQGRFDGESRRGGNDGAQPSPVFFPPTPPPLGRLVSKLSTPVAGRFSPPLELAAYVNEPFYPALGTHLARGDLKPKQREKLDAYRAAKVAARRELEAELERTRDAEPAARQAALEALARAQAARLAALEQTAEELRAELSAGNANWNAYRDWHLGAAGRSERGDSPNEVAQVLRAAAYYQADLLPAQRRLLREIFLEVAMSAEDAEKAAAAQPHLFFPPEPARVLLPDDLPADLAALVGQFQSLKSALKKELYDLVYSQDNASFGFLRNSRVRALASDQAARLATLEPLAERIRAGLRQLPDTTPPPPRSPLPPALTERTIALIQRNAELQNQTRARLDDVGLQLRLVGVALAYQFETDGLKITVLPRRGRGLNPPGLDERIAALRERVSAIEAEYQTQVGQINRDAETLRQDIAPVIGTNAKASVESTLTAVARYAIARDNYDGYRDYRIAVFEPGLSPEQRRLLFDGALEKLAMPLPRGELQPTRRAMTW